MLSSHFLNEVEQYAQSENWAMQRYTHVLCSYFNTASILASLRARASTLFGFLPANLRAATPTCWYITPLAGVVPSSSSDQGNVLWRHEID